jgi:hypothetical protein
MSAYNQNNYASPDQNSDCNLDDMARNINQQHKAANSKATKDRSVQLNEISQGFDYLSNSPIGFPTSSPSYSFFSTQGDFSSGLPANFLKKSPLMDSSSDTSSRYSTGNHSMENDSMGNDSMENDSVWNNSTENHSMWNNSMENKSMGSNYSFKSFDGSMDDISSSFSSLPSKLKRHLKNDSRHIHDMKNKDDKTIINHLKKCIQCREQLLKIISTDSHIFSPESVSNISQPTSSNIRQPASSNIKQPASSNTRQHVTNQPTMFQTPVNKIQQNSGFLNLNFPELKDLLVILLVGIIIIVILDIFFRR